MTSRPPPSIDHGARQSAAGSTRRQDIAPVQDLSLGERSPKLKGGGGGGGSAERRALEYGEEIAVIAGSPRIIRYKSCSTDVSRIKCISSVFFFIILVVLVTGASANFSKVYTLFQIVYNNDKIAFEMSISL